MDKWLDRLDRLLTIIRPKAYNIVAKSIIGLGVILVADSQLNIVQAIVIALYESFFGYSEVLREFINNNSSPWLGLVLIIIGLIYHYLMTIGKEQIELRLYELPKVPEISLALQNADYRQYENKTIEMRGHISNTPPKDEIPEYKVDSNIPNMEGVNNALNTFGKMGVNPNFYRERGELLKVWGGSELLRVKITNNGEALATGVRVEIKIPRIHGVSADNTREDFPKLPKNESDNMFGSLSISLLSNQTIYYDIEQDHTENQYCFYWNVDDIQANTNAASDTCIFLRSEQDLTLEIIIYCDQLSAPTRETYLVTTQNISPIEIATSDLMAESDDFNILLNKCVMDGYIQRFAEKKLAQYEHESQELIP